MKRSVRTLALLMVTFLIPGTNIAAQTALQEVGAAVNLWLEAQGFEVRLDRAESFTASGEAGQTVFFNDRTRQLDTDFVIYDERRGGTLAITWQSDRTDGTANGVTLEETQEAVESAMRTQASVRCRTVPLFKISDSDLDLGLVEFVVTGGASGSPVSLSDITHAGFGALEFPGGILGVTFTFLFVDGDGNPTDIDRNRKLDVAFREIYYNNSFLWATDGINDIDVETVALHEAGHGLGQGHFGKLFRTDRNGRFHFAPRAVMNAGYTGPIQELTGADVAGQCIIWTDPTVCCGTGLPGECAVELRQSECIAQGGMPLGPLSCNDLCL